MISLKSSERDFKVFTDTGDDNLGMNGQYLIMLCFRWIFFNIQINEERPEKIIIYL